ncbi:hypothetical protein OAG70_00455 [bacterium]|nr:hypothetical protein [bacterium]
MNNNSYFLGPSKWHGGYPDLQKIKIIAAIKVIHEREPSAGFHKGNQYREILNQIYGAKVDHAEGINEAIINIALEIAKLPSSEEEEVLSLMPEARNHFDKRVKDWLKKKGGENE